MLGVFLSAVNLETCNACRPAINLKWQRDIVDEMEYLQESAM